MFVDDKNLMHNGKKPEASAMDLMTIITHNLLLWDRNIWITGSLIERLKAEYSLMVWSFEITKVPSHTQEHCLPPNTIVIKCPDYIIAVKCI
eukprot:13355790-Ditylum_brightwellii.AAC.1